MGQREGGGWWGRGLDRERERRLRPGLAWAGLAWPGWLQTHVTPRGSPVSGDFFECLVTRWQHYIVIAIIIDISHQWQKLVSASPESKEKKRRTGHITLHYAVHPGG